MSVWLLATLLLVAPLAVVVAVALTGDVNARMTAVQIGGTITALALALMTFATDQSSFVDLALCLTLLSVPGTLVTALFMERWL